MLSRAADTSAALADRADMVARSLLNGGENDRQEDYPAHAPAGSGYEVAARLPRWPFETGQRRANAALNGYPLVRTDRAADRLAPHSV